MRNPLICGCERDLECTSVSLCYSQDAVADAVEAANLELEHLRAENKLLAEMFKLVFVDNGSRYGARVQEIEQELRDDKQ